MDTKLVILEYQDNFADDLSIYAYGKIAQNKYNVVPCRRNFTSERLQFENKMKDFKLQNQYVSAARVDEIAKKAQYMDYSDFKNKIFKQDKILNLNNFKIDDIKYLTEDIKNDFSFNNLDFIKNYDILESINTENSIGLYINKYDKADNLFIEKAVRRLNKYLKKPKLYIFAKNKINIQFPISYETLNITDWREEFYFLKSCRHKIIHCSKNSYSEGIWASILSKKNHGYVIFDKKLKPTNIIKGWISV